MSDSYIKPPADVPIDLPCIESAVRSRDIEPSEKN